MWLIILKIIKITEFNFIKDLIGIELDEKRLIDFVISVDFRKNRIRFSIFIPKIVRWKR